MRYAVIDDGVVTNVIEVSDPATLPSFALVRTDVAGIGWLYDAASGQFARPSEAVTPVRVIPRPQFKMRIPPQKYGMMRDLIATDIYVWTFLDILNDPALTEVELDSPFLADALDYMISAYPDIVSAADKAAWLA